MDLSVSNCEGRVDEKKEEVVDVELLQQLEDVNARKIKCLESNTATIIEVCRRLETNSLINELRLERCNISSEGWEALGKALSWNSSISRLWLLHL